MAFDAKRVTAFDDGVTDRWYWPPIQSRVSGTKFDITQNGVPEYFYYAFGNPQRTLRPNYDRRTEFPNLP